MDPNTCLSDLLEAIADDDHESAFELASSLLLWLDQGGFVPGGGKLRRSAILKLCCQLTTSN